MIQAMNDQKRKIHPHKFTLWVAIGSILMMFAGLTSAYIVKRSQASWLMLEIPVIFWYSTAAILASSLTVQLSLKALKAREMMAYKRWLMITAVLGVLFLVLQIVGFKQFGANDIRLIGAGSNASYSFLLAISGLHGLHVLGGVIALVVIAIMALRTTTRNYNTIPLEVAATYWHFVDALWIYLFIFFNWMK
ncbi:MAG: heme-copper oxidase subunit III [Chitinophagaceae bacterium]|jgi:cytochrome c oxidase subunit 3|nr:heme-copper oxidase subunit III [Chitinophagaceae bacterium]